LPALFIEKIDKFVSDVPMLYVWEYIICYFLKVLSERCSNFAAGLASEIKYKIILYAEDSSQSCPLSAHRGLLRKATIYEKHLMFSTLFQK
jgi:hypothetical protein